TQIVRETFASANKPFILAAIKALPKKGLPTATAFLLAHQSGDSEFIEAVTQQCEDLPKALHQLNHPSANVPNLADLRKTQDWTGYESPDFSPLFEAANQNKSEIASQLLLSDTPTEEEIRIFVEKLLNPKTIESLGAKAVAAAAIQAASQLANDQQHATSAIALAKVAQRMGASLTETLRVQATSFTSLGDFTSAHKSWIDLVTHQPEAEHESTDYSEAAYTAFENSKPAQAIEILEVGIFRFSNDVSLAIRAGQIALLTNHSEKAVTYFAHATKLGLPPTEMENTTALLAIAHANLGDNEKASSYFAQLTAIDPAWSQPESIQKLSWPESFKTTLQSFTGELPEIELEPLPENDLKDTALPSGELPMPEPPLPSR
ncbi:MAG: tetratricopeptide repeat protein, partial [Akkermansiaceae bacterium]